MINQRLCVDVQHIDSTGANVNSMQKVSKKVQKRTGDWVNPHLEIDLYMMATVRRLSKSFTHNCRAVPTEFVKTNLDVEKGLYEII